MQLFAKLYFSFTAALKLDVIVNANETKQSKSAHFISIPRFRSPHTKPTDPIERQKQFVSKTDAQVSFLQQGGAITRDVMSSCINYIKLRNLQF